VLTATVLAYRPGSIERRLDLLARGRKAKLH
jgi:hypothetical protein